MFGGRRRVEEDLERIRLANLPTANLPQANLPDENQPQVNSDADASNAHDENIDLANQNAITEQTGVDYLTEQAEQANIQDKLKEITNKEILAMILAALSHVVPYVGIFALLLLGIWVALRLFGGG